MGKSYKENVQLVISHQEGSGGNFLARLFANVNLDDQTIFRTDTNLHPVVLATGNLDNLNLYLRIRYVNHSIIVTHCQDIITLREMFPSAKIIQIYPYSHIGNVLYNISSKKLKLSMSNLVDNHLIQISEWFDKIQKEYPKQNCTDYWDLTNQSTVERMLGISLDSTQSNFFNRYWDSQIKYELNWPTSKLTIRELLSLWELEEFNEWFAAWTIFVFEKTHNLKENTRLWSIDQPFKSWENIFEIEQMYTRV